MAQFTISYTSAAGDISHDSPAYSDANGDKFTDWLYATYPAYSEPDEDGNVTILPQTLARTAQAFRDWADAEHAALKKKVVHHIRHHAAQDAANAVPDIDPE